MHTGYPFVPSISTSSSEPGTGKQVVNYNHADASQQGNRPCSMPLWNLRCRLDPASTPGLHSPGQKAEPRTIEELDLVAAAKILVGLQSGSNPRHSRLRPSPTPAKAARQAQMPKPCFPIKYKGRRSIGLTFEAKQKQSKAGRAASVKSFVCEIPDCSSTFARKNEWNRHVKSKHKKIGHYRCDMDRCTKQFDRKDLFVAHLHRMHAPWSNRQPKQPASKEEEEAFEKTLPSVCDRCWREPPNPDTSRGGGDVPGS